MGGSVGRSVGRSVGQSVYGIRFRELDDTSSSPVVVPVTFIVSIIELLV